MKEIEIVIRFESDQSFTRAEALDLVRQAARFVDEAAEDYSHPSAEIVYSVAAKLVTWITEDMEDN